MSKRPLEPDFVVSENLWNNLLVPDTQRLILGFLSPLEMLFIAWTSKENYRFCRSNYDHGSFYHLILAHGTRFLCTTFEKTIARVRTERHQRALFITALTHGNMETLDWYSQRGHNYIDDIETHIGVLRHGAIPIVESLDFDKLYQNIIIDDRLMSAVFDGNGGIELIWWLSKKLTISLFVLHGAALRKGRVDIATHILHRKGGIFYIDMHHALIGGHINAVEYVYGHLQSISQETFEFAVRNSTPEILDWIWEKAGPFDLSNIDVAKLIISRNHTTAEWVLNKRH
jgi:hypothetical protein